MGMLTHAVSGALLARERCATLRSVSWQRRPPELDGVLNVSGPLVYLNWHRGYPHSLLLLALWVPQQPLTQATAHALPQPFSSPNS